MSQAASINIGSKIRVTRVRDRIPQSLVDLLKADASGTVSKQPEVYGRLSIPHPTKICLSFAPRTNCFA